MLLRAYAHRVRSPARPFAVFLVPTVMLVGQQAAVVKEHTDLSVEQFYGAMGVDFWNKEIWARVVNNAEVLVMTPQILLDNLRHSFFHLEDIALLIFDECHHAKGDSPYACILKEFYHSQLSSRPLDPLPRIFGLHRTEYGKQISELENLMNSKVYTVDSESALLEYIPFATTRTVEYDDFIISPNLRDHITICLHRLEAKHLNIVKGELHGSSLENAEQRISRLNQTFLYCIANLGVWLAAKAAEIISSKENILSIWGEQFDKNVEGFVRNYSNEVYTELSFSTNGGEIMKLFPRRTCFSQAVN